MTTITPSCEYHGLVFIGVPLTRNLDHAEQYSPDDNRFDLRPFLYPSWFGFQAIEKRIAAMGEAGRKVPDGEGKKDS
jgi:hypothetical protein